MRSQGFDEWIADSKFAVLAGGRCPYGRVMHMRQKVQMISMMDDPSAMDTQLFVSKLGHMESTSGTMPSGSTQLDASKRNPFAEFAEAGARRIDEWRTGLDRACKDVQRQAKNMADECTSIAGNLLSTLQEHYRLQQQRWPGLNPVGLLAVR